MKSTEFLKSKNIKFNTIHFDKVPKTAQDVENIYGCSLHQVLKTLVFIGSAKPVIVVLAGDERVNVAKLKEATKQSNFRLAKPDEVKEITGYRIGEVSPFGIEEDIEKIIDTGVFKTKTVNMGSGKADIGIEMEPQDLKKAWDGMVADITG